MQAARQGTPAGVLPVEPGRERIASAHAAAIAALNADAQARSN
jgi:hypothetical protein